MSKVEVNQISSQCGSTLTIGQSGDTVQLASGASQTGFGRSGSVNWDTTAKTAAFTAVSGNGYFVNTSSAAITVTLPASPSAGDIVAIKDYTGTFQTNNCTIARNSSNIRGAASDFVFEKTNSGGVFIYVDATEGWQILIDGSDTDAQLSYITATGGTVTTCGDFKIHTFTGPGTFTVSEVGDVGTVDYLVVAGGGGASGHFGAGGGAGGFRYSECTYCSPAPAPSAGTALPVSAQAYPITVGGGGAGGPGTNPSEGSNGNNSIFSTITSTGGGTGADDNTPGTASAGGSGGGGNNSPGTCFGAGNTPPVSPPQGNPGSNGRASIACTSGYLGGAGGGAAAAGNPVGPTNTCGAVGGDGYQNNIDGTTYYYAGGGGGSGGVSGQPAGGGDGGNGGGGGASNQGNGPAGSGGPGRNNGGNGTQGASQAGGAGGDNTGGGGGGAAHPGGTGGAGGSGIVIIRYKYQ
jgi:hypothetical protein